MKTYYDFKKEVIDKGFDVDGWYGFQCWDGMAFYEKWLGYPVTNTDIHGFACDIWESRKTNGILNNFIEVEVMKPGDIAIFKKSAWTPSSHVAIFDSDIDGVYGWFLGQNQGGTPVGAAGGSGFNVINMSMATFMGAFRFKKWKETPAPAPTPKPADDGKVWFTYKSGDTFGQKILELGLGTGHGLWGADGDVAYYTNQLHEQGIYGNLPLGVDIWLKPRK